jgi:hypothetical protein
MTPVLSRGLCRLQTVQHVLQPYCKVIDGDWLRSMNPTKNEWHFIDLLVLSREWTGMGEWDDDS